MDQDRQSKAIGITVTVLGHVLVGLIFWFTYFGQDTSMEGSGVLVMVGIDAEGSGQESQVTDDVQPQPEPTPQASESAPTVPPEPAAPPAPEPQQTSEPLLAQTDAEAPAIAAEQEKANKAREAEQKRQQELERQAALERQQAEAKRKAEEEAARRAAEEAAKRQAINNQIAGLLNNKGTGTATGQQGSPNGNSSTGATSGSAGYGEFDLGGRGLAGSLPRPVFDSNMSGKVVVYITVDASGIVKSAVIGKGTTISDQSIRNAAREAALKARFNAIGGSSLTPGTITYYFDSNN